MPDIILFGATGYTGRLTAAALGRRGASFAVAGRNPAALEELAAECGAVDVHVADAADSRTLVRALKDSKVLLTCVGPFVEFGTAAVHAALEAGVHYLDSTGEGKFIRHLIEQDKAARTAGIAMIPAMGFDEVPCDVAVAHATQGLERPHVVATYAVPTTPSAGSLRSAIGIMLSAGRRIHAGAPEDFFLADRKRVAPMPPPLGPKTSISAPLAMGDVAPLLGSLEAFETYVTIGPVQERLARVARAPLGAFIHSTPGRKLLSAAAARFPEGPDERARNKWWTVLVEARSGRRWRNVALQGKDVYGLTAETLSAGALAMADPRYASSGVLSPVQGFGVDLLEKELRRFGVSITSFGDT
ncbi:MAG TPA: saccharopine dehydrogenase NADP-binding domain-containing protein [Actinomycetota bacterium]|nr:saccharopine dehydrogenase NADP-binding domain-containing protein [Actinomycetota bacterium]